MIVTELKFLNGNRDDLQVCSAALSAVERSGRWDLAAGVMWRAK